jgi:hypothetical protein
VDEVMTSNVTIDIGEHDGHTRAVAHLHTRDNEVAGVGFAGSPPPTATCPRSGPSSPPRAP